MLFHSMACAIRNEVILQARATSAWRPDLEAAGGGNVPYAQGAVQGGRQQPARICAHAQVCDAVHVALKLAHAPHRLNVIPVHPALVVRIRL